MAKGNVPAEDCNAIVKQLVDTHGAYQVMASLYAAMISHLGNADQTPRERHKLLSVINWQEKLMKKLED